MKKSINRWRSVNLLQALIKQAKWKFVSLKMKLYSSFVLSFLSDEGVDSRR